MKRISLIVFSLAVVAYMSLVCLSVPMVIELGQNLPHPCPSGSHWGTKTTTRFNETRTLAACYSNDYNQLVSEDAGLTFYTELVGITLGVELILVFAPAIILLVIIAIRRWRATPGAGSSSAFGPSVV